MAKYDPLRGGEPTSFDEERIDQHPVPSIRQKSLIKTSVTLTVALLFSASLNALLLLKAHSSNSVGSISRSPYAGLLNDLDVPFVWNTEFSGDNYTAVNRLWYEDEQADEGIVALENDYARELGLPDSQPFPWDSSKKGIYIVNGHHNLHCLRNIYISLDQFRANIPQTLEWPHILHCLDTLRSDILCNADDTPRFTEKTGRRPGVGQIRKCRDWSKLQEYVRQHAGCFHYIQPGNKELKSIERLKFCPNDSPYLPLIREYFGLPDDWMPWPERE